MVTKKKGDIKKFIFDLLNLVILGTGIGLIISGVTFYWVGFHNVDLAYNAVLMNHDVNKILNAYGLKEYINYREMEDTNSDFISRSLITGYINGVNQQEIGSKLMLVGGLLFGSSLTSILETKRKRRMQQ